jgi:ABC-type xylose transport system substrate-binding protein
MTLHCTAMAKRLIALAASAGLLLAMGACSRSDDVSSAASSSASASSTMKDGNVVIFAPSDGITISQQTPLSKWEKLVPEIVSSLKSKGVDSRNITVRTASSLDRQSQSVQDYVVNHVTGAAKKTKTTLVVAPVANTTESDRQYGDYVSRAITWNDDSSDEDEQAYAQSAERLVSALRLAQDEGMKVVLISNSLQEYVPDAFVKMSDAEQIGMLQAQKLASKLALDKTSSDNPKHIEVLLPYDTTDESGQDIDATFAQSVFKGIWKVLGPYFKDGKAVSPSGKLTASSTDDDWRKVAFEATKSEQIRQVLAERLGMDKDRSSHTRIDGVIACNDFVADAVIAELSDLAYTGSAADINPSITISGIMDNIAGKHDLKKKAVPDPIKAPESDDDDESADDSGKDESIDKQNAQWPIVTGYGAYAGSMPSIVNGQQWMTALENRKAFAQDIAEVCVRFNASQKIDGLSFVKNTTVSGQKTPTVQEDALAVSAYNLKKTLIEPGYISLADAGM